jgi:hypothetical protein
LLLGGRRPVAAPFWLPELIHVKKLRKTYKGDSMYQNQIVSLIGLIFPEEENASASFALFQVRP